MKKILIICFMIVLVGIEWKKEIPQDADLLDTKWILSYIQGTKTNAITHYPSDATKKILIVFADSLNVIGFNGVCNGGAGIYTYSPATGEIKITDLIITLIGCK